MADVLECYKVLDVPAGCPPALIRKAYVALCQVWDPARFVDNPPLRTRAEEKRRELDEAYRYLKEFLPELRGPLPEMSEEDWVPPIKAVDHVTEGVSSRHMLVLALGVGIGIILVAGVFVYLNRAPGAGSVSFVP